MTTEDQIEYAFKLCEECRKRTTNWSKDHICINCGNNKFTYEVETISDMNRIQSELGFNDTN